MNNVITVLLADDHPLIRAGFILSLKKDSSIKVIADADTPEKACLLYEEHKPDVVVMDIRFQGELTGFDAVREILKIDSSASIVMLSQYSQAMSIKESYEIGAKSFITKTDNPDLLITAIKAAAKGELYFTPEAALKLATLTASADPSPMELLSKREFVIYKAIASDKTAVEIAKEQNISEKAVHNAIYNIKKKTGLKRTTQIAKDAQNRGIV